MYVGLGSCERASWNQPFVVDFKCMINAHHIIVETLVEQRVKGFSSRIGDWIVFVVIKLPIALDIPVENFVFCVSTYSRVISWEETLSLENSFVIGKLHNFV